MTNHPFLMPTTSRFIAPQTSHSFLTSFILMFSSLSLSHAAVVVVDLAKMMDEDEEVVLELSNWIGENEKKLSLYGVISLPLGDGEGWLVLYIFDIGEVSLEEVLASVWV